MQWSALSYCNTAGEYDPITSHRLWLDVEEIIVAVRKAAW